MVLDRSTSGEGICRVGSSLENGDRWMVAGQMTAPRGLRPPDHENLDFIEALKRFRPHDHVCLIYESPEDQRRVFVSFMATGLEQKHKIAYLGSARAAEEMLADLKREGLEPESLLERGQLAILTYDLICDVLDPETIMVWLRRETERALGEGYAALRITVEMDPDLWDGKVLAEYESRLDRFLTDTESLSICGYELRRFDPQVLMDVLRKHPIVIVGTKAYHNLYYVSPAELKDRDPQAAKLDLWLKNLSRLDGSMEPLQRRDRRYQLGFNLRQNENVLEALFDSLQDLVLVVDLEGRILRANQIVETQLGYTPEELLDRSVLDLHPPDRRDEARSVFSAILAGECDICDIPLQAKDGSLIQVETIITPGCWGDQEVIFGVIRDVTERKRTETELQKRTCDLAERVKEMKCLYSISDLIAESGSLEEGLKRIADLAPQGWRYPEIASARIVLDGAEYRTLDFKESDIKQTADIVVDGDRIGTAEVCYSEDRPEVGGTPFLEEERDLLNAIAERIGWLVERKRAEKALKEHDQRREGLLNALPDIVIRLSHEGEYLECHIKPEHIDDLYLPPEALVGRNLRDVMPPEIADAAQAHIDKALDSGEIRVFEYELSVPRGVQDFEARLVKSGPNEVTAIIRNVTERKRAEEKLHHAHRKLLDIVDFLPDATFVVDQERRVIAWNRAVEKMTGVPKEDVIGKGDYAYSVPFYGTKRPTLVDLVISNDKVAEDLYDYVERRGETIFAEVFVPSLYEGKGAHVWAKASPLFDLQGEIVGVIESIRDITDRKLAEEALRESEKYYRNIFENSGAAMAIVEGDGTIVRVNSESEKLLGYKPEEVEGTLKWGDLVTDGDLEGLKKLFEKNIDDFRAVTDQYEVELIDKWGNPKQGLLRVAFIPWKRQHVVSVINITERKQAETALQESEKRFRELADLLPQTVFETDDMGNITFVNEVGIETYGYSREDLKQNFSVFNVVLPKERDKIEENFQLALKEDQSGYRYTMLKKDGSTFPAAVYSSTIVRDDRTVGMRGIVVDMTERNKAEKELKRRERLLSAVALAANALLAENDLELGMNQALNLLGLAEDVDRVYIFENRFEGAGCFMSLRFEWTRDKVRPQIDNPVLQDIPYEVAFSRWYEKLSADESIQGLVREFPESERAILGAQGTISVLVVPIMIEEQFWGFVGLDDCHHERVWDEMDISILNATAASIGEAVIRARAELKIRVAHDELERRVMERTEELNRKNAEMERFAYTVSHDLRSPLVTVAGFVGLLKEDIEKDDRERIVADLRMIEDATSKMDRLLIDTLELSRIGRVANPSEDMPFCAIVQEALDLTAETIRSRGFEVSVAQNMPTVRVDRTRIVEALVNLVENSLKYSEDQESPRIDIGYRIGDEGHIFFVQDNGRGIDPHYHEKVFELFYKLNSGPESTGAGLAIVKRIIEVHGGRIWIESEEGKGCSVCFTLPLGSEDVVT